MVSISCSCLAGPGDGIQVGDLILNPFIEVNYTMDSNINLDPTNELDDAFLEGIGGLQFHLRRESYVLEGRGFGQKRQYEEFSEKDFTDWGEGVSYHSGDRGSLSVSIEQKMRSVTDYDRSTYFGGTLRPEAQNLSLTYDRSTRVERRLHDVGVILGRSLSDILDLDIGFGAGQQDYSTNVLFDIENVTMKGEIGWRMTDKMSLTLAGELTEEKNDSFDGRARATAVQAGLKRRTTDKLEFKFGLGMTRFTRPEVINDYGREVQERTGWARGVSDKPRNDETALSFDLSGTWVATDKITLELAGHSAIQSTPQYPNTIDHISVASASAVYDFSDTVTVSLTGSFRRDDYLDPVVELGDEVMRLDERTAALARIDYIPPRRFLTLFLEGGYEQSDSTIWHYNYDQLRLGVGISLRY